VIAGWPDVGRFVTDDDGSPALVRLSSAEILEVCAAYDVSGDLVVGRGCTAIGQRERLSLFELLEPIANPCR
jgi:hypothetical protein